MDYSQIVLDKIQWQCLIRISENASQEPDRKIAEQLRRKELVRRNHAVGGGSLDYDNTYSVTEYGDGYIQYRKQHLREKRKEDIRYWITTAIAVAAFIKSFFF